MMSILSASYIKEKWQHAGFQKYLRNTGWMFFSRVLSMVISFFTIAIVIRYLGPEKYGIFSYAVSFVGLFSFLASLGIDQILYRELIKNPEKESQILGTSFILKIIGGVLAIITATTLSFFLIDNQLEQQLIFIISLSYIFQSFNILNYSFQSRLENKKLSIITIIVNVLLSLLKISIVFANKGILFLSAVLVIEPIVYGIFFIYYYSKNIGVVKKWSFDLNLAKYITRLSLPLMFSSMFALIYSRIDQIMIKHYLDPTSVGLYSSSVTLSEIWYFIPTIMVSTLFPSIINSRKNNKVIYANRIKKLLLILILASLLISIVGTIFSKLILFIIFGSEFVGAYTSLQIYIWSSVGFSIGTVIIQTLVAEKLSPTILYISIIGMILNVLLNIFLIPRYGINGAAIATLISYLLGPLSLFCFKNSRTIATRILRT